MHLVNFYAMFWIILVLVSFAVKDDDRLKVHKKRKYNM